MPTRDEHYMRMALNLAAQAKGQTSPNPLVGAVIVKDGQVVGTGYHQRAGGPHAEVYALQAAGQAAQGATLYVTLEPCSHFGRTPPCADAVIAAGIQRVVAGMSDPNPRVSGRGIERLQRAGIQVDVGTLGKEAARLNAPFITYISKKRPYVLLKSAATLDGRVATRAGASRWISGPQARELVHRVRSEMDAIMVGSGTVLADDPLLTARPDSQAPEHIRQPIRVIVDSTLRVPLNARCLDTRLPGRAIVATTEAAPADRVDALHDRGIAVWQAPAVAGKVDLAALLRDLAAMEITTLLLEGGPTLAGSLFDQRLIDACMFFISPMLFGGPAPALLGGTGVELPVHAPRLADYQWRQLGDDLCVEGILAWPNQEDS